MANSDQTISIANGYVLVERPPEFEVHLSEQLAALKKMAALCNKAGTRKVLVVGSRTKVMLSKLDIYNLGKLIAKFMLHVAIVELHDVSVEEEQFLENVTSNRGKPLKFFDNINEAKIWLKVE